MLTAACLGRNFAFGSFRVGSSGEVGFGGGGGYKDVSGGNVFHARVLKLQAHCPQLLPSVPASVSFASFFTLALSALLFLWLCWHPSLLHSHGHHDWHHLTITHRVFSLTCHSAFSVSSIPLCGAKTFCSGWPHTAAHWFLMSLFPVSYPAIPGLHPYEAWALLIYF